MTYQEKFDELRNEFAKSSDKYIKADQSLSEVNGFGDSELIEKFAVAKKDFEIVGNDYHHFLDFAKKNNAKPEDEYGK
jgi:hypothetical protein